MSGAVQAILDVAVPATTPLLLGCMGAIISERSGVINLGMEGAMSVGALTGIITSGMTGSPWLGFGAGVISSTLFMGLLSVFCITLKSDQVITGVMVSLLGVAVTTYFGESWTGTQVESFNEVTVPVIGQYLVQIPLIGKPLFMNSPIDYMAFALVPMVWYFLFRTNVGMRITAVGNDPETADTMSINVTRIRHLCVLLSGAFAGAAGVAVSLAFTEFWTAGLINNRGWIAVALVIVARWHPFKAVLGSYLFGIIFAMQFRAQSVEFWRFMPLNDILGGVYQVIFNPVVMSTYPFLITIAVLVVATFRSRKELGAPQALTEHYIREAE